MLAVLQRPNTLVRRYARDLLYTDISQLPGRQQIHAGNSFQSYCYSLSAPIPGETHAWTNDEIYKLAEYINSEYLSRKQIPRWNRVGAHFGIPPRECKDKYFSSYKLFYKKKGAEAATNDEKDSRFAIKPMPNMAQKIASSHNNWTADEVARLREAMGDRNKRGKIGWHNIAKYVGAGKTGEQCEYKWNRLCFMEDIKALDDNQSNSTVANESRNTKLRYRGEWTPEELSQLKALFDIPSDPKNSRMRIAYALFPQKTQVQVRYTMDYLHASLVVEKRNKMASKSKPLLKELVSDSGGAEKADWDAISRKIGLSALQCQRIYYEMTVASTTVASTTVANTNEMHWTSDELDRLLTNLRSQHVHGGAYDWDLAAAAVGTRNRKQCRKRFCRDLKNSSRCHLYDFGSLQE